MKKKVIAHLFTKSLAWILLIQVVNISIDPIDPLPVVDGLGQMTTREDLSINDIESIYELVSEQCLHVDVPEQDEDDESGFIKVIDFYFSENSIRLKEKYVVVNLAFFLFEDRFPAVILDHTSPPPRVG